MTSDVIRRQMIDLAGEYDLLADSVDLIRGGPRHEPD